MPQRRINTPIPTFSAGWANWAPVLTFYIGTGAVVAAPLNGVSIVGRVRTVTGMVEYEAWITWQANAGDPGYVSFTMPPPVAGWYPLIIANNVGAIDASYAGSPPAAPYTLYEYDNASDSPSWFDGITGIIVSNTSPTLSLSNPVTHSFSGYYPVVI